MAQLDDQLTKRLQMTLPRARLKRSQPPGCPALALWLVDPASLRDPLSSDEISAVLNDPAYWTFCWASGQVLAQQILQHPEQVRGRVVLDFGTGSGIVAIAAAKAGAARVIACDNDPAALLATRANAALNQVTLEYAPDWYAWTETVDVLTAADVLYDQDNFGFLAEFKRKAHQVWLADSRVKQLPDTSYALCSTASAHSWPDLNEPDEFHQVRLYQWLRR